MSAKRIILKRSSLAGKRPSSEMLSPGELALNTNSLEPGVFMETTDNNIVKVGPTAVLPFPPSELPGKGESWFDTEDGTLKIGNELREWRSISAPYLGGSGTVVFVAPEFKYSTDSLQNDGQALPFQTISRAVLELSKVYLSRVLGGLRTEQESNRYTIYLAPSAITVNNGPGRALSDFSVDFPQRSGYTVTASDLEQFNTRTGGVIIPSGITIIGMDLKRCELRPTYVPSYSQPAFPESERKPNQDLTSVFKCSGNSYASNFSVVDKFDFRTVSDVVDKDTFSLFKSVRPHGLHYNEKVDVVFGPQIDQTGGTFSSGVYYAIPYDTFSFFLSPGSQEGESAAPYVSFSEMPSLSGGPNVKFEVSNSLYSAHRLRLFENVSLFELGEYYTKVQKAFSGFFGGRITDGQQLVNPGDHVIVAPLGNYPQNYASNDTKNSSFYANQVNLRSNYGMCWGDFDGSIVSGFRSVIANACTSVSLQNDPGAYEIYTTLTNPETNLTEEKWWNLPLAAYLSLPESEKPSLISETPIDLQINILNQTPISNIRYFYKNLISPEGKSIGIVDINQDFRHFGFRVRNGAFGQFQSTYTVGPAVGVWALNGGICNLTNSTSNFGSVAIKAEGFLGINSIGGAKPNSKGFVLEGVQRPLALTKSQTESDDNKRILSLGSKIVDIYLDEEDPNIQILELSSDFSPCYLLPYSLLPGSAIWVETEGCTFRGFLATDGGPTIRLGLEDPDQNAKLRIRASDSTIPTDDDLLPVLGIPYIRRFLDPRQNFERVYSLLVKNTGPNSIAPQVGSVLRLNQTSQELGSSSLKPNVQFDPGVRGGWGRIFTVDEVETGNLGSSPQFNYVIGDSNRDQLYFLAITATDYSRPWTQGPRFKLPSGSYTTFKNRNWYTAENNLWDSLYYGDVNEFTENSGPYSISPTELCSPFIDSSVSEKQELVSETHQGEYSPDPFLEEGLIQPGLLLAGYDNQTYFRGATDPYPTYSTKDMYDDDDGTESLGLCLKTQADGFSTFTVSGIEVVQTETFPSLEGTKTRYRPEIIEFLVLSSTGIPNPKQTTSVLKLGIPGSSEFEYVRVINLNGAVVRAIRLTDYNSGFVSQRPGSGDSDWSTQTPVRVCSTNAQPNGRLYDPDWSSTKKAILRFFEVMGYSNQVMDNFLEPKYWGERFLPIQALSGTPPLNGYALTTDRWPIEFNQPSTIIANTHTWTYSGFYTYSRGLPEYQSNEFSRKLAFDFQATATWSGRLTITGVNDKGEIVQFGPQRQALTANYYEPVSPVINQGNQQIYEEQEFVEFPSQVIIYSADDISDSFDGLTSSFDLTRTGLAIPPSQLTSNSVIVTLGGVVQKPVSNYIINGSSIVFSEPPPGSLSCNIRVVTSSDSEKTLTVLPLTLNEEFDGVRSIFTANCRDSDNNPIDLSVFNITAENIFLYLGGVQQIPLSLESGSGGGGSSGWSYTVNAIDSQTLQITFSGAPSLGSTQDSRVFCSGPYWSSQGIYPVKVYPLDSLTPEFNGAQTSFTLRYDNRIVNPSTITSDNILLSLGGAVQVPGISYSVQNSVITFLDPSDPPRENCSVDIRVIGNSEFIPCGRGVGSTSSTLPWGDPLS